VTGTAMLHDLLDRAAERWPERPAVSASGRTLRYGELAAASVGVARWLAAAGVRRGDRVVSVAPSGVALVTLVYAAARLGAAFVVLHEQVRGAPLEHVLADCEPALLVTDDVANLAAARRRGIATRDLAQVPLAAEPAPAPADPGAGPIAVDPVCLIYTSGTTSLPKAVVSTHAQVVFAATAIQSVLRYRPDDTVYCPLPLSFDYGLYQVFLGALSGAHVWLGQPAEVGPSLLRNLVRTGATVLPAVPAVADALARLLGRPGAAVPSLRLLTNTGAAMPPEPLAALRARIPGLRVQLMFGLTECKRATVNPPDADLARPGSCGRALPGTEVYVVDDAGRRLPPGEVGEVVVRGPHVMAGYWRRPELTAQRFPRREGLFPELHTGDYGWLDAEQYLYFAGRRDDIYKERGFRVSATEVEAAARRVPGVRQAVVLPPAGAVPAALLAVTDLTADEVLAGMREQVEEFKIPQRCLVLPDLPLTPNGKVDRRTLAARLGEAPHA